MGTHIKLPLSGGNWNNSSNAGVFARNLNNASSNSNTNVGGADSDLSNLKLGNEKVDHRDMLSSDKRNRAGLVNSSSLTVERLSQPAKRPKRVGFLFEEAFTRESLMQAYLTARKDKRKKPGCIHFEMRLGAEIDALLNELHSDTYKPKPMITFHVHENGKRRLIHAPQFRDLIVQHAIYRVIYPIFDASFIDQSFACRKGGGTHKASDYAQKTMRKHDGELYYAKLDIRKFFYSITHKVLRWLIERKIKDKRFVNVMMLFVGEGEVGLPIGNLLSQIYALIVMNPLDHFAKRVLKVRHYVRYVDDFVAIGLTLEQAKRFKAECERFAQTVLGFELSHWMISKIRKGLNFVGYRTWRSVRFVRKHSVIKFKRAVKAGAINSVTSLLGHAAHSATIVFYAFYLLKQRFINQLPLRSKKLCLDIFNTHQHKTRSQPCALLTKESIAA